jgi:hypothetical protein
MLGFKEHQEVLVEKRKLKQDPDLKKKTETGKDKSVPAKTYKGLSKSTKEARHAHFQKNKDKADNDPSAYEPAPGDGKPSGKESKYTKAVHKKYPHLRKEDAEMTEDDYFDWLAEHYDFDEEFDETLEESAGDKISVALKKKAEASGVSASILRAVFNRGMSAFKGSHRPGQNQHSWSHARVNAFLTPGSGARKADADLWARHLASKKKGKPKTKPSTSSKPKKKSSRTPSKPRTSGGKAKLHP